MMSPAELERLERLEHLAAQAQNASGAIVELESILKNRVQQSAAVGTVVAAGAAITPDASITTKGTLGKIRISATFSGQVPATTTCTAHLQVAIGGGAFVEEVGFAQATAPAGAAGEVNDGVVFEFDSGAPAGTVLHVHWETTLGDGALTLGAGAAAAPIAAVLLVEELP
jgi:hypothetical protein